MNSILMPYLPITDELTFSAKDSSEATLDQKDQKKKEKEGVKKN